MARPLTLVLLCGTTLALPLATRAQDHGSHAAHQPARTPPPAEDHSGHAGHQPAQTPSPTGDHSGHAGHTPPPPGDHSGHDGHDMSAHDMGGHTMTGALGSHPMSREASGTSWQPDAAHHGGVHRQAGDWTLMGHAELNLVHTDQSGPRGDAMTFVAGMVMASARRDFDNGSTLNLRAMLSPDPFMGEEGYPLLLASGETADGIEPLIDRQHPHDLFMELSASYAWRLSDSDSVVIYGGLPGEPAFGPPAFMHRPAAIASPEAPITHHWLDSTHITFGVLTAGWIHDGFKLEASAFRGREPNEERYDIETGDLDSWSVRASWNPTPNWALQVSRADVVSPEQLEPDEDEVRWSASALYTAPFMDGDWSLSAAFGRKIDDHDVARDAWLLEASASPDGRWTGFSRIERIETAELEHGHGGGHGDTYTVGRATLGLVCDFRLNDTMVVGLGGSWAFNFVPDALEADYGGDPDGAMVFVRLRIQ